MAHVFLLFLGALTATSFAASWGFASVFPDRLWHLYSGLTTAIACLFTHCWVFFYFIGTGQGIREGVVEYGLDRRALKTVLRFKARVFPFAFFAMIFAIVGSVLGGALRAGRVSNSAHAAWALFAFAFNLFTFRREYRIIRENRALMAELNAEIG